MKQKLLHSLGPAIVPVLLAGAFWSLHHELRHYQYADLTQALAAIPENRLLLSFALTMLNYVMLTGYDALALRYIRHPLAYRRIALASFIGYTLSHNIGLSVFSGSAVRYRFYATWGLSTVQIAEVVACCILTLWLGILANRRENSRSCWTQERSEDKMARVLRRRSKRLRKTATPKERACLRCDRRFLSEGPHNRLCQTCREFLAGAPTPVEEYHFSFA
jgi:hypothetical protein